MFSKSNSTNSLVTELCDLNFFLINENLDKTVVSKQCSLNHWELYFTASLWREAPEGGGIYEDLHSSQPLFNSEWAGCFMFIFWSKNVFVQRGGKHENFKMVHKVQKGNITYSN